MATIALYAGKLNQMPGLINDARKSVDKLKTELFDLQEKAYNVDTSVCDLSEVISSIQASAQTQENRIAALESFQANSEEFIREVIRIDNHVADTVNQNKDDFYKQYEYLKPDSEKSWLQIALEDAGEWCEAHWKELVMTVVIVAGAVLTVVAVVCTGGVALAPMLAAGFTALGVASGTALTAATVISFVVAGVAVTSTIASSTLNLIDLWGDMSGNSTFQAWKTALNWTSMISNGFYSVGSLYNGFKGISNQSLKEYGKRWLNNTDGLRDAIRNADAFPLSTQPNASTFWAGLGKNGEDIAKERARSQGLLTLERSMEEQAISFPTDAAGWSSASASFALRSTGEVRGYFNYSVIGTLLPNGKVIGSTWLNIESIILNINPRVTSLIGIDRVFQWGSALFGIANVGESIINAFSEKGDSYFDNS